MALLVMFSTLSFSVDMHYCGDSLVDFSLFQKAVGCGMEKAQANKECEHSIAQEPCCSDHQFVKESNQRLKSSFDKLSYGEQIIAATFFYTYANLAEGTYQKTVPFQDYPPPFIKPDIQILYETFLI